MHCVVKRLREFAENDIDRRFDLLQNGNEIEKLWPASVFEYFSLENSNEDNIQSGIISCLITILRVDSRLHQEGSARVRARLSVDDLSCASIVTEGAIPLLVSLLKTSGSSLRDYAAFFLNKFTANNKAYRSGIKDEGAIPPLVQLFLYRSNVQMDQAVRALANMTIDDRCRDAMVREGAIPLFVENLLNGNAAQ
ncbi:hypothetical protein PHMEG_00023639 [Phytophthora megakarya]|uniref:Uncharacterized protein n=1 Tax=Phytophthora megakarya TaxID=4795 RepID=A0A225VGC4_9STRA|nr:hypothetical protein PHMEG_00023639 [Phytophthora megakarya]